MTRYAGAALACILLWGSIGSPGAAQSTGTFTQRGKRMTESVGWRITAWAWAAGH